MIPDCFVFIIADYHSENSGSNSVKGSILNDTILSTDSKGNDMKLTKNNFNNANVKLKGIANDRESIALLHNVIPIHRRLDENTHFEENSTLKDIDEESLIQIGQTISEKTDKTENSEASTDSVDAENYKTITAQLSDTAAGSPYFEEEKPSNKHDIQKTTQTSMPNDDTSHRGIVSVGSPEVHTISIQELFEQFFSRHHINASKIPGEVLIEPKRNNSKQPSSIVEIYDSETESPAPVFISDMTTKIDKTSESSQRTTTNTGMTALETDIKTSDYKATTNRNVSDDDYATEPATNIIYITTYNPSDSFSNFPTESKSVSSILSSTNTRTTENFQKHTGTESTLPPFLTTKKEENKNFQEAFNMQSTIPLFSTADGSTNWDFLETDPSSQTYSNTGDFYNQNFPDQTSTTNLFTGDVKQTDTDPTSSIYTTFINEYNERLRTHPESKPSFFISDSTHNLYSDVTNSYTETKPMFSASDNTENVYSNRPKPHETQSTYFISDSTTNSEEDGHRFSAKTQPTFFVNEGTSQIYSKEPVLHSDRQTTVLTQDSTDSSYSDEPETDSRSPSTFSLSTTLSNLYNEDIKKETEIQSSSTKYTTTAYTSNDDYTEKQPSSTSVTSTGLRTNAEQKETEFHEQTNFTPSQFFSSSSSYSPVSSVSNNENNNNVKGKQKISISSILSNTRNLNENVNRTRMEPDSMSQFSTTKDFSNDVLNKDETQSTNFVLSSTNENILSTSNVPMAEISTAKEIVTAQTPKLSTRINSKLPSYIEKTNENNDTTFYSRFPVLTDSIVNVYLPAEGREAEAEEKKDFTNVGTIYLGAPLSVGGTDSRKDTDNEKPKITQSGGVIFMDPKYTDIDTKMHSESQEKVTKWPIPTSTQKETSPEISQEDIANSEPKKGPRIQDTANQSSTGQAFKIIPFVAEDAIRGQFGKLNNTLLIQQGATEGLPDMVSGN